MLALWLPPEGYRKLLLPSPDGSTGEAELAQELAGLATLDLSGNVLIRPDCLATASWEATRATAALVLSNIRWPGSTWIRGSAAKREVEWRSRAWRGWYQRRLWGLPPRSATSPQNE